MPPLQCSIFNCFGDMDGTQMKMLAERLFPICRSITGQGVRETLAILQEFADLTIHEVSSGTQVFDWTVPQEWNVSEAWIANTRGERAIDFTTNNLHLLQYSQPFDGILKRSELERYLHTLPDQPTLIPYKTSYYRETWGFCLSEEQKATLVEDEYQVHIASSLQPGVLNYGEILIPGTSAEEILISTHICHPSLANDNLSGIVVALNVVQYFTQNPGFYSIRVVLVPGTIGAITWLAINQEKLELIRHGLVITGLGAGDTFHYKRSELETNVVNRVSELTLRENGESYIILPFSPYGYDERQYNSPGIRLPVGCLMRTPHGSYPEYHTSADNLSFLQADALEKSSEMLIQIIQNLSANRIYQNTSPFCEPQLGKRGLYTSDSEENLTFLWLLNQSDGSRSLLDIATRSGITFSRIVAAATRLLDAGLLKLVA